MLPAIVIFALTATVTAAASAAVTGYDPDAARVARSTSTASAVSRPKALNPALTRAQVVSLYNDEYLPGNTMPAIGWTGSVAGCDPGAISVAFQLSMIARINVFRKMARLAPVTLNSTPAAVNAAQAAALLMVANNQLSHTPPNTWICYNQAFVGGTVGVLGSAGAATSNLGLSSDETAVANVTITDYMDDVGAGNIEAGHRAAILDAAQTQMSVGVVLATTTLPGANAMRWLDFSTRTGATTDPDGMAWPPRGFVPFALLPVGSNRWSFRYPGADFSAATVTMTSGGAPYAPVAYDYRGPGCTGCAPDDGMVWRPPLDAAGIAGVSYPSPGAVDKTYTVNINGVQGVGFPTSFSYTVTVIDPAFVPVLPTIVSGTISNATNTGGVAGVAFCARPQAGVTCTPSDGTGAYSCTVPTGWTGVLHSPIVGTHRIPAQVIATAFTGTLVRNFAAKAHASFPCNLDIDNNGLLEPSTDGVAILRRMEGVTEAAMAGLVGTCAATTTNAGLFAAANPTNFGAMGVTPALATTDGLLLTRAISGLTGTDAVANLTARPGTVRTTWGNGVNDNQIRQWLNTTCGTDC